MLVLKRKWQMFEGCEEFWTVAVQIIHHIPNPFLRSAERSDAVLDSFIVTQHKAFFSSILFVTVRSKTRADLE